MPNHNDMCESINAMVDNIRKRSPNISLFRAVQVVQFRKNAKCLGATIVEDISSTVLVKFENENFVNEVISQRLCSWTTQILTLTTSRSRSSERRRARGWKKDVLNGDRSSSKTLMGCLTVKVSSAQSIETKESSSPRVPESKGVEWLSYSVLIMIVRYIW